MTLEAFGREHGRNIPRGVRSLTFFLKRSPELIEDNSGKRFIRRSVCVPFPTPGAPTRMILAARERAIMRIVQGSVKIKSSRNYVHKVEAVEWRLAGAREVMGMLEEGHTGRKVGREGGGCGLEGQPGGESDRRRSRRSGQAGQAGNGFIILRRCGGAAKAVGQVGLGSSQQKPAIGTARNPREARLHGLPGVPRRHAATPSGFAGRQRDRRRQDGLESTRRACSMPF
jgi:hypothetical protein